MPYGNGTYIGNCPNIITYSALLLISSTIHMRYAFQKYLPEVLCIKKNYPDYTGDVVRGTGRNLIPDTCAEKYLKQTIIAHLLNKNIQMVP